MSKQDYRESQRVKPIGPAGIEICRKIVAEKQAAKVNEVMVDLFSASAIVQVFDAIGEANRVKLVAFPVAKVADVAFKILNWAAA